MLCRGQAIGLAVLCFGAGVLLGNLLSPCWTGASAGRGGHCGRLVFCVEYLKATPHNESCGALRKLCGIALEFAMLP